MNTTTAIRCNNPCYFTCIRQFMPRYFYRYIPLRHACIYCVYIVHVSPQKLIGISFSTCITYNSHESDSSLIFSYEGRAWCKATHSTQCMQSTNMLPVLLFSYIRVYMTLYMYVSTSNYMYMYM